MPVFARAVRVILLVSFIVHIYVGTLLKLENYTAKPRAYIVTNYRRATFARRYQKWTGRSRDSLTTGRFPSSRYDFVAMHSFRLVYYLFWHIGWGTVRLGALF
jgi:hypothetical protein